ncbi:hypothetical protein AGLY_010991, partial [Aphis glycines]
MFSAGILVARCILLKKKKRNIFIFIAHLMIFVHSSVHQNYLHNHLDHHIPKKTDTRDPGSAAEKPIASQTYVPLCSTYIILLINNKSNCLRPNSLDTRSYCCISPISGRTADRCGKQIRSSCRLRTQKDFCTAVPVPKLSPPGIPQLTSSSPLLHSQFSSSDPSSQSIRWSHSFLMSIHCSVVRHENEFSLQTFTAGFFDTKRRKTTFELSSSTFCDDKINC